MIISSIVEPNGRLVGFSKVTRDLTERREHEKRLEESERNLRQLVEGVQDYAIFTLDPNGFITSWNLGAERIKGYTPAEAIGKPFEKIITYFLGYPVIINNDELLEKFKNIVISSDKLDDHCGSDGAFSSDVYHS